MRRYQQTFHTDRTTDRQTVPNSRLQIRISNTDNNLIYSTNECSRIALSPTIH